MAQKSKTAEPKIRLTSCDPRFRVGQFAIEKISDESFLTMRLHEKGEFLNESFFFTLFETSSLSPLPDEQDAHDDDGKIKKYLCAPNKAGTNAQFYILLEQGELGFDVSHQAFMCDLKLGDNEADISIKAVDDNTVLESLKDSLLSSGNPSGDVFFETVADVSSSSNMQTRLEVLEQTEFIKIPPDSRQYKLGMRLTSNGEFYPEGHIPYNLLSLSADGKDYLPKDIKRNYEIGTLLYKRDSKIRNRLNIVRVVKFVHDFRGYFYAVAELVATYPRDAEMIKATYPTFYKEKCMPTSEYTRIKALKNAVSIPYISEEQQIGDGVIYVPVDTTTNEISVAMNSPFQFSMEGRKGLAHYGKGNGKLRISHFPVLCAVIECDRRFRIVYYKVSGYVKHNDQHYAELRFQRASQWLDSFNSESVYSQKDVAHNEKSADNNALAHASLLLYRNLTKPIKLEKKQLGVNLLDAAKNENIEDKFDEAMKRLEEQMKN
jgi:hypothetical protein